MGTLSLPSPCPACSVLAHVREPAAEKTRFPAKAQILSARTSWKVELLLDLQTDLSDSRQSSLFAVIPFSNFRNNTSEEGHVSTDHVQGIAGGSRSASWEEAPLHCYPKFLSCVIFYIFPFVYRFIIHAGERCSRTLQQCECRPTHLSIQ